MCFYRQMIYIMIYSCHIAQPYVQDCNYFSHNHAVQLEKPNHCYTTQMFLFIVSKGFHTIHVSISCKKNTKKTCNKMHILEGRVSHLLHLAHQSPFKNSDKEYVTLVDLSIKVMAFCHSDIVSTDLFSHNSGMIFGIWCVTRRGVTTWSSDSIGYFIETDFILFVSKVMIIKW